MQTLSTVDYSCVKLFRKIVYKHLVWAGYPYTITCWVPDKIDDVLSTDIFAFA